MEQYMHIIFQQIGPYKVFLGTAKPSIAPKETEEAIAKALNIPADQVAYLEELDQLILQYAVYPPIGEGRMTVSPEEAAALDAKHKVLGEHERLTVEGQVIPDWVGSEYYRKDGAVWTKGKVEAIGAPLPEGAVLIPDLTAEQNQEIAAQHESVRISALSNEEKAKEKKNRLDALADEADRLERRAKIQGEEFDAVAWYQEHKAPIEAKYA
jgi:hypothetical protein